MEMRKETKWLCQNAHALERYSGKWVLFDAAGVVKKDESLAKLLRTWETLHVSDKPFVFHVPSKRELASPLPAARRR